MRNATEQDFDDIVMKNDKPVLVDFWAPGARRARRWPRRWTSWRRNMPTRWRS
ncbi:hypothetical protein P0F65_12295 [Sphingomonas sp. I4]